jgi:hypothetical protein
MTLAATTFWIAGVIGCYQPNVSPGKQTQQRALHRADRSAALLKAAAAQLNDLPAAVDTTLRPPVVVLDATKSGDGEDIFAVIVPNPSAPTSPASVVTVPAGNARFRSNGIRSGDILKYYVVEDETVDEESRRSGFTRRSAIDLVVAQVIDDQTLLIEDGLNPDTEIDVMLTAVVDELGEQGEIIQVRAEDAFSRFIPQGLAAPIAQKIEIWRHVDDRLKEINRQLVYYRIYRKPALGWEPGADDKAIAQIVVWLNQWLRQSNPNTEWRVDPLLKTLRPELLADEHLAPRISDDALGAAVFEPHEGRLLQEAVWHRDISRWASGDSFRNVDRAAALFDWTIRNVQLEPVENRRAHRPWHVLLYGRGTAEQRAWVFALLCRQIGLDVVMLALQSETAHGHADAAESGEPQFWLPALVDEGRLFLFDTRLGLAVPGPPGDNGSGEAGIATLEQVQNDDSLLRQLDLPDAPYPVTSTAAKRVVAYIVADPLDLTRRARQVQDSLTGDERLVLTIDASALAEQLKSLPQLSDVRMWELPYQTLRDQLTLGPVAARNREVLAFEPFAVRPMLWKARMRHFQGRRSVADADAETESEESSMDDHGEAARLYTSDEVRPADRDIEREARRSGADQRRVDMTAKLHATYWLGLLSYDDGRYDVAAHWLSRPELQANDSPWRAGARYNLARTYEAQEKFAEAAALLENDNSQPAAASAGNKLRAQRLKSQPVAPSE